MSPVESGKLDIGLIEALRAYEESQDKDPDDGISVGLRFEGELAAIEALGFETHTVSGQEARGVVRFNDVSAIAAHPGVLWIAAGSARRPNLGTATKDICARASSDTCVGIDGVWYADTATGAIGPSAIATGAGVIVAVIDSGIDYTHPMFMKELTPTKETRILWIWDQGLLPASLGECPPVGMLHSKHTYGVEFTKEAIDDALDCGESLPHMDCLGHGTHVAGIAAGRAALPTGVADVNASAVGVAPCADIIVVKQLDVPEIIRFRHENRFGKQVGADDRARDAVVYCLRRARALGKPVVINMSSGDSSLPGDALDDFARWVDELLDPSLPPDDDHFPSGAIAVAACGNDGDVAERRAARIRFPSGGRSTITVPIELHDDVKRRYSRMLKNGRWVVGCPTLSFSFWYRHRPGGVKFRVKWPGSSGFTDWVRKDGGSFDKGLKVEEGPEKTLKLVPASPQVHMVSFQHKAQPWVDYPHGGHIRRHVATLSVRPMTVGNDVKYLKGLYEVQISARGGTEIFLMSEKQSLGGSPVTLSIGTETADGIPLNSAIEITSESSATDTLGANAITVAAYVDRTLYLEDGTTVISGPSHRIASASSRGPLRNFADSPGSMPPIATKPDLAAPGVKIWSAWSAAADIGLVPVFTALPRLGCRFTKHGGLRTHSGTSMAAPMVAGVVALMLSKNPKLSTTDVHACLTAAATCREGTDPARGTGTAPLAEYSQAYGSGMADALESVSITPLPPP